ncbi:flagellar biosynthesis protein FlhA [Buchnera aphidicola (Mollitrichosiphum nigrofasciatum)]|uniref:flagellar biosynthesis protein FlhA n=1 Tax=Buchnera aphidicola TaxID=9 RepID=UPI0031B80B3D
MNKLRSLFFNMRDFELISWKTLITPIFVLILLIMIILPLPPFFLDLLFTFNISISVIILLVTMFVHNILDFSGFPVILLFITLLRVFLNVASARAILLYGHNGTCAVGHVIESFGKFLVGGNFSIGIIIFIILVIINFMVITKGAERVAEVNARFILDSMPGKQMSVDSDLNAGIINNDQAKKKRKNISKESDFYGSMDGASKFIRGDAIASILILVVNIFGGLIIGVMQHGLTLFQALDIYTLLTIGDGLVAQIPALVISTAAGIIVTRVNCKQDLSFQIVEQLFYNPKVIFFSAMVIGVFGLIPGMPNFVFLSFSSVMFFIFYKIWDLNDIKNNYAWQDDQIKSKYLSNISWDDMKLEDIIRLELGDNLSYLLIDKKKKIKFLHLITVIRQNIANDVGFLPPSIHICNNFNLGAFEYRFYIKGIEISTGEIFFDLIMAADLGGAKKNIFLNKILKPTFGFTGFWIEKSLKNLAKESGYTILKIESIIVMHLKYIILQNIHELLGRNEVKKILYIINKSYFKFAKDLIPKLISLTTFHAVLKNLLHERIFIKDMYTIIESLLEFTNINNGNINDLVATVRISLGKYITQKFFYNHDVIKVIGLNNTLEDLLLKIIKDDNSLIIDPILSKNIIEQAKIAIFNQMKIKAPLVLLVNHRLRFFLAKFFSLSFNNLTVLSVMEIVSNKKICITNFINYTY